jgi:hypothetical protein
MLPPDPRYIMSAPAPERRIPRIAIFWWILTVGAVVVSLVCGILIISVQPSALEQIACGLGNQAACNDLNVISITHGIAILGAIGGVLFIGLFAGLALWETFR